MKRLVLLATLFVTACPSSGTDVPPPGDEVPTVHANLRVLDAMAGAGMEGVDVETSVGETATTDSDGAATVPVEANGSFSLRLTRDGALDHLLFGPTADDDFEYITFLSTEALFDSVLAMLGATHESGTGVVVVGIDYDDLQPVVGASATISLNHDAPWVLSSNGAAYGDTVPSNGMGMVAFPNVQPGDVSVTVSPPGGTECTAFPGGGEMPDAPVEPDVVTVVTFHCR